MSALITPIQLMGTVVLPDGTPMASAQVVLIAEAPFGIGQDLVLSTTTDRQGQFRFTLPFPQDRSAVLIAFHTQWLGWSKVSLAQPVECRLSLVRSRPLQGTLRGGANRTLRLRSLQPIGVMDTHLPNLHLAKVCPEFLQATTDEAGQFSFPAVPENFFATVEVDKPLCAFEVMTGEEVIALLPPTGFVTGQVRQPDGVPLPNATVQLLPLDSFVDGKIRPLPLTVVTDEEGHFCAEVVAGDWLVWLPASGKAVWVSQPQRIQVTKGSTVRLTITAQRPAVVRGWVADAQTRFPLPQRFVRARLLTPAAGSLITEVAQPQPEGAYELRLPAGVWELFVADEGWQSEPVQVETAEGAVLEAPAIFARLPLVSVRVQDAQGQGRFALLADNCGRRGVTDPQGQAQWLLSSHGRWLLASTPDGQNWAMVTLPPAPLPANSPLLTLVLQHSVPVRGQVVNQEGRPQAGVLVSLCWVSEAGHPLCLRTTRTDGNGLFRLSAPTFTNLLLRAQRGSIVIQSPLSTPTLEPVVLTLP